MLSWIGVLIYKGLLPNEVCETFNVLRDATVDMFHNS